MNPPRLNINGFLLTRYPGIWLSRIHIALPVAVAVFFLNRYLGETLPLIDSTGLQDFLPLAWLLPLTILWIRFQFLHFQPMFNPAMVFRLFLLNGLIAFLLAVLAFQTSFSIDNRIQQITTTRNITEDLDLLKLSALYKDSINAPERTNSGSSWFLERNKIIESIKSESVSPRDLEMTAVLKKEPSILKIYRIPVFIPMRENPYGYCDKLSRYKIDLQGWSPLPELVKIELIIALSLGLSIFILQAIVYKKLISFFSPFVAIVLGYGCVVLMVLTSGLDEPRSVSLAFILLIAYCILYGGINMILYSMGRKGICNAVRMLSIQCLGYLFIPVCMALPMVAFLDEFLHYSQGKLSLLANITVWTCVAMTFLVFKFYIKAYLSYSFLPRKTA